MTYSSTHRGYTLLFAVLTATLVLGVTVFILSTSRKQFILASTARESMYSFYAADSGIECISLDANKYKDIDHNIKCNDSTLLIPIYYLPENYGYEYAPGLFDPTAKKAYFTIAFRDGSATPVLVGCAKMAIIHYYDEQGVRRNVFQSRGYNLCEMDPDFPNDYTKVRPVFSSSRLVERALELTYKNQQ